MSRFWEGLVVGGAVGYVIGLLSAPKSGAELRRQIADGSEDLYKQASDSLCEIKEKTGTTITDLQSRSNEVLKKASDSVAGSKDQIAQKLQELAGQSKVMVDDVESATSGG